MDVITGCLHVDEKKRCLSAIADKYENIDRIHVIPLLKTVRVEVTLKGETKPHKHYLKKKPCGGYEEYETPLNDR